MHLTKDFKIYEVKPIELKEEVDKSIIRVGVFNPPLSLYLREQIGRKSVKI